MITAVYYYRGKNFSLTCLAILILRRYEDGAVYINFRPGYFVYLMKLVGRDVVAIVCGIMKYIF